MKKIFLFLLPFLLLLFIPAHGQTFKTLLDDNLNGFYTMPTGVKGDGTTDDATALNAYFTAQGAYARIKMPKATYKINSTLK